MTDTVLEGWRSSQGIGRWDFPGGPVVKTLSSSAGGAG